MCKCYDSEFMKRLEAKRLKKLWSVVVMAEHLKISDTEYNWYRDGLRNPPPRIIFRAIELFGYQEFHGCGEWEVEE